MGVSRKVASKAVSKPAAGADFEKWLLGEMRARRIRLAKLLRTVDRELRRSGLPGLAELTSKHHAVVVSAKRSQFS
jgi:hypothetical protein